LKEIVMARFVGKRIVLIIALGTGIVMMLVGVGGGNAIAPVVGSMHARSGSTSPPSPSGQSSSIPGPPTGWRPSSSSVALSVDGAWSWALRDRDTGEVIGSHGTMRNTTESMIKSWIAVDYVASKGSQISLDDEALIHRMIHSSDDSAAQELYSRLGSDASVRRMIERCSLTETEIHPSWWSKTLMSAADATKLGLCVARGPGISPDWRDKILDEMRNLEPSNNFGVAEAPALRGKKIAVKNGWTLHGETWAVNCLAVWGKWALAVMVVHGDRPGGHLYAAKVCSDVAERLFKDQPA
jgi:hypothetical protein